MNMRGLFHHIGGRLKRDHQEENPEYSDQVVTGFLRVLEDARLQDVPCDQVYARLDEYVESEVHGEDAAKLMPLLREHLDTCPDCCEEYEALLAMLRDSAGEDASP